MQRWQLGVTLGLAITVLGTGLATQAPAASARAVAARAEADEAARLRGDSAAWARVAPGFLFVHSSGVVDVLAAFPRFRARGPAGAARAAAGPAPGRGRDVAPPVDRLDGDVFVRVRLLGDSAPPGVRPGQSRVLDVYVRRGAAWHWLAHQTSGVRARWVRVSAAPEALAPPAEYAGAYATPDGRRRTYAVRGDSLVQVLAAVPGAESGSPAGRERALVRLGAASFGYEGLNATVTFVRDRAGRVVAAAESSPVGFVEYARVAP